MTKKLYTLMLAVLTLSAVFPAAANAQDYPAILRVCNSRYNNVPMYEDKDTPGLYILNHDFGATDFEFFLSPDATKFDCWTPTANTRINIGSGWSGSMVAATIPDGYTTPEYRWTLPGNSGTVTITVDLKNLTMEVKKYQAPATTTYPEKLYVTGASVGFSAIAEMTQSANDPALYTTTLTFTINRNEFIVTEELNSINTLAVNGKAYGPIGSADYSGAEIVTDPTDASGKLKVFNGNNYWDVHKTGTYKFTVNLKTLNWSFTADSAEPDPIVYVVGEGDGLTMDYANPMAIQLGNTLTSTNVYPIVVNNLQRIAFSTAKGSQEEFEAKGFSTVDPDDVDVRDANRLPINNSFRWIDVPVVGNYQIVVSLKNNTVSYWCMNTPVDYDYLPATNVYATQSSSDQTVTVTWDIPTGLNLAEIKGFNVLINNAVANGDSMIAPTSDYWRTTLEEGTYNIAVETVYDGRTVVSNPFELVVKTNGIEGISADNAAVYFDVNGRKVANPEKGMYIRVANGKSEKVIVK